MATLLFKFVFANNASPQMVLTSTELTGATAPTVNISTTAYADGAVASAVAGGALTYDSYTKSWSYRLASADLATYLYVGMATTTYATASPASVHALGIVVPDALTSSRLAPTVTGRTLDVSATGEAGVDWANVGTPGSTVALTNTQINSVSGTVGSVTGLTPATVADAVWDEAISGHVAAGSAGAALTAAGAAGDPWSVELPGAYASTEAGGIIGMLAGIDTSAVTVTSSNNAGVLTFTRGVTFSAVVSGLTISATWAKLYFTLKESDYDTDEMALLQLVVTSPAAALTDGLLYLDGSDVASPITHADGTLTVSQVAGTVGIAITDNATVLLSKASGLVWDIKTKDASGATVQNATGTASITQSVTQTI